MDYTKYDQKAREIQKYCRNKRWKYKLTGGTILLVSAAILFALLVSLK